MTTEHASEIRTRLDGDPSLDDFEREDCPSEAAATDFFQDLFVGLLGFDATPASQDTTAWRELPVDGWSKSAHASAARFFGRSGNWTRPQIDMIGSIINQGDGSSS